MISEDDPTIVSNILEEFRAHANNLYRSSMLPISGVPDRVSSVQSKARRLKFEDSSSSISDVPDKKLKLTTPQTREVGKSSNGILLIGNYLIYSVDFQFFFINLQLNIVFCSYVALGSSPAEE